jgi:hypothetical protein
MNAKAGGRRILPSLAIFAAVQAGAALWIRAEVSAQQFASTFAHTLAGPLNLFARLDRLQRYGQLPDDAILVLVLAVVALLPWMHVWRPRWPMLIGSVLGSLLWAVAGFGFSIDHL